MKKFLLSFLLFGLFITNAFASHLRSGDITVKRISSTSYTYQVTLITYTDEKNGKVANDAANFYDFYFGNASTGLVSMSVSRSVWQRITPEIVKNVYDTTFTFPGPGTFTISVGISARNDNTLNLNGGNSGTLNFFVQTTVLVNAGIGINSSPVMLNIPLDSAAVGNRFVHNPGAFDIDGDSLSYKLVVPRSNTDGSGVGYFISTYKDPSTIGETNPILNENESGPAFLSIDPITGDLVWDCPRLQGQYNVAFVVEEWRKSPNGTYIKIGEIVRDMQIIVVQSPNKRPKLELPSDLCVEAGESINLTIKATDSDNDKVSLESTGGIYNKNDAGEPASYISPEAASFSSSPGVGTVSGQFKWVTNCNHIRDQPYFINFKAIDQPGRFNTQLVDLQTLQIKVLPARPKGLTGTQSDAGVQLTWQKYPDCDKVGRLYLYRKVGCNTQNPSVCSSGIDPTWGYEKIAQIPLGESSYLDSTVVSGTTYSYRLISEFDVSIFVSVQSPASNEFCMGAEIKAGMPVLTKNTVDVTNNATGQITVKWTEPLSFNPQNFPGPYSYKLYRATGINVNTSDFTLIKTFDNVSLTDASQRIYVDNGLNTEDNQYTYKLEFYTAGTKLFGTTGMASSVYLNGIPDNELGRLSWQAQVPWNNFNQTHFVYREDKNNPGKFNIIAAVNVNESNTFNFVDSGADTYTADGDISIKLVNGETYCYKVETYGAYDDLPNLGQINNFSQSICLTPQDRTPPCVVQLSMAENNCESLKAENFCESDAFTNKLSWSSNTSASCSGDIVQYEIYYSRYEGGNFSKIATVNTTNYDHVKDSQSGFAGCYNVIAINALGLRSEPSETVCADNCDNISFPNVFSPNGDGVNDTFTAMNCPAFVKSVSYDIFSRDGRKVYSNSESFLNWNGKDKNGKDLPTATYYYLINVTFEKLETEPNPVQYKGYVQLMR